MICQDHVVEEGVRVSVISGETSGTGDNSIQVRQKGRGKQKKAHELYRPEKVQVCSEGEYQIPQSGEVQAFPSGAYNPGGSMLLHTSQLYLWSWKLKWLRTSTVRDKNIKSPGK